MAAITTNNLFENELRKLIAAEREDTRNKLESGSPVDYAAYRERVGFLRALKEVEDMCLEVNIQLEKR